MADRTLLKRILADPKLRREMAVRCVIATQAREGIVTPREQAEAAVDKVAMESQQHRSTPLL